MQITDPTTNPRLFIEQTRVDALQKLRPGQVVRAVVETPPDKGIAQINIGGIRIPMKTGMKLVTGQQLALDVVKTGNTPEFKVINETTASGNQTPQTLALKSILPKQLPVNQLFDALKSLTTLQQISALPAASTTGGSKADLVNTLFQQLVGRMTPQPPTPSSGTDSLQRNVQIIADALRTNSLPSSQINRQSDPATDLVRQISQLLNQPLSNGKPITAETIRQALNESGLFLEARLIKGQPVQSDLKGNLLRLLETLQPMQAPPHPLSDPGAARTTDTGTTLQLLAARLFTELHHQAEGALARVQLHQLAALPQDDNNLRQLWQFELPIPHGDGHDEFLVKFEREARHPGQAEDRWSVTLNFNIPPTGPVCARLSLAEDEISSHFTAEFADGAKRIEQLLPTLNEAFARAGLKVGKLSASQGIAVTRPDQPLSPLPLLDERA